MMLNNKLFVIVILFGSLFSAFFISWFITSMVSPRFVDDYGVGTICTIAGFLMPSMVYMLSILKKIDNKIKKVKKANILTTVIVTIVMSAICSLVVGWLKAMHAQDAYNEGAVLYFCIEGGVVGFMIPSIIYICLKVRNFYRYISEDKDEDNAKALKEKPLDTEN